MFLRLFNASLRLGSLGLKLILTLYMARYLPLEALGTYGLVAAYVSITLTLIGVRFDYVILRDIVGANNDDSTRLLRDQFIFYGLNYLFIILAACIFFYTPLNTLSLSLFLVVIILSIMENLAAVTTGALTSMKQPIMANFLFFLRSAAWVPIVIVLGLLEPSLRTAEFIFLCWGIGVFSSLVLNGWLWRERPWRRLCREPVRWAYMRQSIRVTFPIWLGTIGLIISAFGDRFIIEHYLGRDSVGIVSFYGSFIIAVSSLLTSGIFAFAYPQLVELYRAGNIATFTEQAKKMTLQAITAAGLLCVLIGLLVPWLGGQLGKAEFMTNAPVLWLLLLGVFLRSASEGLYYMLYARDQDRPIWVGNILYMLVTIGAGLILIPWHGLVGAGYASVIASVFIGLWRMYYVNQLRPPNNQL